MPDRPMVGFHYALEHPFYAPVTGRMSALCDRWVLDVSFQTAPRRPRVTARVGMTVRMGRDDAPLRAIETGMTHNDRSMRHRAVVDPGTGFTVDVLHGRTAGLTVNPDTGNYVCAVPTSSPNADDRRAPTRSINGVLVSGRGASVRAVRTADMPDDAPIPGIPRRTARSSGARSNGATPTVTRTPLDDATVRAYILSVSGRTYTGPIDRTMRAMVRDVMSHRESVARYVNG